jgi:Uma2 family endonuclease
MAQGTQEKRATIKDLHRVEGQAELIGGRIVSYPPAAYGPGRIAGDIMISLYDYAKSTGRGIAGTATLGFVVPELSSGRESFCCDASYYDGPRPTNPMDFIPGPPTLAVEVRSEPDYGPAAETALAAKRADYFEAGTRVVWDVDPEARCVRAYRSDAADQPTTFTRGQTADAEPAVPGWRLAVDDLFA